MPPRGAQNTAAAGSTPAPRSLAQALDEIAALFMDATVLSYALKGVVEMAVDCRPVLSWEDELEPLSRLAGAVAVRARELYPRQSGGVKPA